MAGSGVGHPASPTVALGVKISFIMAMPSSRLPSINTCPSAWIKLLRMSSSVPSVNGQRRGIGVGVGLGVFVDVAVGIGVTVGVSVAVGVADGMGVSVGVGVRVGVFVGVSVGVDVKVAVGVGVEVGSSTWKVILRTTSAPLSSVIVTVTVSGPWASGAV